MAKESWVGLKKNMKNKLMEAKEKFLLMRRGIIETVNGQLKEIFNIEHSRHRSPINALVHMLSALFAYHLKDNKVSVF